MFEDYKKYQDLSIQLSKEIEYYESSYQDFEKVIDFSKKWEDLTNDEKKVIEGFIKFCQEEGMYERTRITKKNYEELKKNIQERVNLMRDKKEVADEMVASGLMLDKLTSGSGLDKATLKQLQEKADNKYDHGTEKNKDYLKHLVEEYREEQKEKAKQQEKSAKEKDKEIKKENSYGKVVSSAFGPMGNKLHNLYAKVHNANVNIRKHKLLNLVVKGAMVLGYGAFISMLPFNALVNAVGMISFLVAAGITIKHSLPWAKVPTEIKLKENNHSLKECLFRYRKARGKNAISIKKIYDGINLETTEVKKDEDKNDESSSKVVEKEETKVVEPNVEEEKEEVKTTEPKVETVETDNSEVKEEKKEESSENKSEEEVETTEKVTKVTKNKKRDKETLPEKDSGMEITSMDDVIALLRKLQNQGGIETVDDYFSLKNVRLYLGEVISKTGDKNYIQLRNMFDELAKNMPEDVRERIAIANRYRDLELTSKTTGRKISVSNAEKQRLVETRKEEFERIKYLIVNSKENVQEEVNYFLNHYNITHEQEKQIQELLAQREAQLNENRGKGR